MAYINYCPLPLDFELICYYSLNMETNLKYFFVIAHTWWKSGTVVVMIHYHWSKAETRWFLTSFEFMEIKMRAIFTSLFKTNSIDCTKEYRFILTKKKRNLFICIILCLLWNESDRLSLDNKDDRAFSILGYLKTQSHAENRWSTAKLSNTSTVEFCSERS